MGKESAMGICTLGLVDPSPSQSNHEWHLPRAVTRTNADRCPPNTFPLQLALSCCSSTCSGYRSAHRIYLLISPAVSLYSKYLSLCSAVCCACLCLHYLSVPPQPQPSIAIWGISPAGSITRPHRCKMLSRWAKGTRCCLIAPRRA